MSLQNLRALDGDQNLASFRFTDGLGRVGGELFEVCYLVLLNSRANLIPQCHDIAFNAVTSGASAAALALLPSHGLSLRKSTPHLELVFGRLGMLALRNIVVFDPSLSQPSSLSSFPKNGRRYC